MMIEWTLLLATGSLSADDWTQYRGSGRDAVWREEGLLETFPPEGLKIRWRVPAAGGFSSPVIAQGRVYLCDSVYHPAKARERIRSFDEKTGAVRWTYDYEVNYDEYWHQPKMVDGVRATPVVRDGRLYSAGADGDLACLDAVTGALVWKKKLVAEYGLTDHRTCTPSPLVEGDLLIVVIGGKPEACVVAFEKETGKEAWRALGDRWTYSSPIVVEAGGKRQLRLVNPGYSYLCSNDPRVHFGLGAVQRIDEIHVVWPDGSEETFPGGDVDRLLTLRRGEGRSEKASK